MKNTTSINVKITAIVLALILITYVISCNHLKAKENDLDITTIFMQLFIF